MEAERRGPVNDVEQLLDGIPSLAGQERQVTLLPGGLTNRNYRVRTSTGLDVVVRHSSPQTGLLGVDRAAEHANSVAAADAGVGAPVIDYVPALNVLVVQFLPGRTYADDDVAGNLPRVAAALRRLHAGPTFRGRFDMVQLQRSYLAICTERGFDIPADYLQWAPYAARVASAFAVSPEPLVPCRADGADRAVHGVLRTPRRCADRSRRVVGRAGPLWLDPVGDDPAGEQFDRFRLLGVVDGQVRRCASGLR